MLPQYYLHLLVDIEQDGTDLAVYPKNWTENYIIAYGILGNVSNIDTDKVYDYHTAFDIKSSMVNFNVPIDMKGNTIINSPSLKPQIFAINGYFNNVINATAIQFGYLSYIIVPINCKMFLP